MATYVYETIPSKPGQKARHFEIKQSMTEAPLTKHPETGEPIRRVVTGGFGVMGVKTESGSGSASASGGHQHRAGGACGCGAGGCRN